MTPVVVLDACVLYPAAQRDLFMWLAAGGAIRAYWTNQIHDEWMRNVARDYGVARSELEKVAHLMNRAAGDALVSRYRQHEGLFSQDRCQRSSCCRRGMSDSPHSVVSAFMRMRDNLRNPTKTTQECADTLFAQGLKVFSGLIKGVPSFSVE